MKKQDFIFTDENGQEYFSSPKYNYDIDMIITGVTCSVIIPLMGLLIYSVSV